MTDRCDKCGQKIAELPEGAVRLDSLTKHDYFIRPCDSEQPWDYCNILYVLGTFPDGSVDAMSQTGLLSLYPPDTPVYRVDATFRLKGEDKGHVPNDDTIAAMQELEAGDTRRQRGAALRRWEEYAQKQGWMPSLLGCLRADSPARKWCESKTKHPVGAILWGYDVDRQERDLIAWAHAELKRRGFGRIDTIDRPLDFTITANGVLNNSIARTGRLALDACLDMILATETKDARST